MEKFIPYEKLSKKAKKTLNAEKRATWLYSPVTKTIDSKKRYNRNKKSHDRYDDYGRGIFCFLFHSFMRIGSNSK